jgi:hypothetical protein
VWRDIYLDRVSRGEGARGGDCRPVSQDDETFHFCSRASVYESCASQRLAEAKDVARSIGRSTFATIAALSWAFTVYRSVIFGYTITDGTVTLPTRQQCEEVRQVVMLVTGTSSWVIGPCHQQPYSSNGPAVDLSVVDDPSGVRVPPSLGPSTPPAAQLAMASCPHQTRRPRS